MWNIQWLIFGLIVWLVLIVIFITSVSFWFWWVMLAAVVTFYGPVSDTMKKRYDRERKAEIAAGMAVVEASKKDLRRIERNHGKLGAHRALDLCMKDFTHGLTSDERAELYFLANFEYPQQNIEEPRKVA